MRYYDWPERLHDVIRAAKKAEFKWGKNDCALFACDCILAMTGIDHAKKFRGKYSTRKGAATALKKIESVDDIAELADKYLGERISLSHAQRGDIVLIAVEDDNALGVIAGNHAVFLAPQGILTRLLSKCVCAWKVRQ